MSVETSFLYNTLWYFLLYSFIGWCVEVVFCSVNTGKFVNRGFLNGPLCPIYGFGGVVIVYSLGFAAHRLLLLYFASVVLTSLLELVGGWVLEKIFHTRWWDYSDMPFNVGGYICLKFSLLWGISGVVLMQLVHPLISDIVINIPLWLGVSLLVLFYLALAVDLLLTIMTIKKLDRDLSEITQMAQTFRKPSDTIAQKLGDTAIQVADTVSDKMEDWNLEEKKQRLAATVNEGMERLESASHASKERIGNLFDFETSDVRNYISQLTTKNSPMRNRLLKAFPDMENKRYSNALRKLQQQLLGDKQNSSAIESENTDDSGKV